MKLVKARKNAVEFPIVRKADGEYEMRGWYSLAYESRSGLTQEGWILLDEGEYLVRALRLDRVDWLPPGEEIVVFSGHGTDPKWIGIVKSSAEENADLCVSPPWWADVPDAKLCIRNFLGEGKISSRILKNLAWAWWCRHGRIKMSEGGLILLRHGVPVRPEVVKKVTNLLVLPPFAFVKDRLYEMDRDGDLTPPDFAFTWGCKTALVHFPSPEEGEVSILWRGGEKKLSLRLPWEGSIQELASQEIEASYWNTLHALQDLQKELERFKHPLRVEVQGGEWVKFYL